MPTQVEPEDYAALNAVYAALLAGVVIALGDRADRDPVRPVELVPLGAATFAVSKVVARRSVAGCASHSWRTPCTAAGPAGIGSNARWASS
jgi:hypothetical protein